MPSLSPRTAIQTCPACGLTAARTYFHTGFFRGVSDAGEFAANCACGRGEFVADFRFARLPLAPGRWTA